MTPSPPAPAPAHLRCRHFPTSGRVGYVLPTKACHRQPHFPSALGGRSFCLYSLHSPSHVVFDVDLGCSSCRLWRRSRKDNPAHTRRATTFASPPPGAISFKLARKRRSARSTSGDPARATSYFALNCRPCCPCDAYDKKDKTFDNCNNEKLHRTPKER